MTDQRQQTTACHMWCAVTQVFEFLTVGTVTRAAVRHHTKFRGDRSNRCGDMAIFPFFKMAVAAILYFQIFEFLTVERSRGLNCIATPNFVAIGQTVAEIWRLCDFFQDGGRPPSWICESHIWTIQGHLVVFITVQNLVRIDAVVSIICKF